MKTAKQFKVNNRVRAEITCSECGATIFVKSSINSKEAQTAIQRACKTCQPVRTINAVVGWWHEFGLKVNPYVYCPMPRLRTSQRYRIEEARRMGWMAWTWNDEYKEERKKLLISYS
jgi:predicted nucleic-acid-binding Zn-ribbon protein